MQLAHARNDRLAGLLVGRDAEGRILLGETREPVAELPWSAFDFGSTAPRSPAREGHRLEDDRRVFSRGVSPVVVFLRLRLRRSRRDDLVALLAVVRVHLRMRPTRSVLPVSC
jgi:hypothetical protein